MPGRHCRRFKGGAKIGPLASRRQRKLQSERPAFGQLMQLRCRVGVDASAKSRTRESNRFFEPEP